MASPTTMTSSARPFTHADLEAMPDDGYRREIIGGSLIVTPAPRFTHQWAIANLLTALSRAQPVDLATLGAPFDWRPAGEDVYEPDLLVVRKGDIDERDMLRHGANPVLAVEVLSPSNRAYDLITKRAAYQTAGLAHYWIIDPGGVALTAFRLGSDGIFAMVAEAAGDDPVVLDEPFPVRFSVADLVRR